MGGFGFLPLCLRVLVVDFLFARLSARPMDGRINEMPGRMQWKEEWQKSSSLIVKGL